VGLLWLLDLVGFTPSLTIVFGSFDVNPFRESARLPRRLPDMPDNSPQEQFQAAYSRIPPWDLGRPQKPFVEAADRITGTVLDAGCGTGDNLLFFAERGQAVLGIDFVGAPLETAQAKADQRGLRAEFRQMNALRLQDLGSTFDSVIDCGLFHVFSDEDRLLYVAGLGHVTNLGGRVFLMCFSDEEPSGSGPRRISQSELRQAFADGWAVESITETRFEPNPEVDQSEFSEGGPKAWFAVIRRCATTMTATS
jgi:SAM-dependent methyltransferase